MQCRDQLACLGVRKRAMGHLHEYHFGLLQNVAHQLEWHDHDFGKRGHVFVFGCPALE